ncbi:MAG: methylenetetrahydromethanopterin dehydrogenase [Rhodospirillaceae bacterium]|nr:methylenetetrahydromethanopterin dehydrogenase [Rhodospirillaceae bacterium]
MSRKYILHMITPQTHVSPFDVNMAVDAGFDLVLPYTNVALNEIQGLVQDSIFSRSVNDAKRTGIFICGKDTQLALDMLDTAKEAMVPPFEISVFPDPAGSFTTAAAMVACTEKLLKDKHGTTLDGKKVVIYGGKGIVGTVSGIICTQAGATATLVGYDGIKNVKKRADDSKARFGVDLIPADGTTDEKNTALLADADIVFCAARAGTQVLNKEQMATAPQVLVVADANAVPPAGIEGVGLKDDGEPIESGVLSLGPLTFGDIKVKTQRELFQAMCTSETPLYLNFQEATEKARELVGLG